jgi:hypothetical protein
MKKMMAALLLLVAMSSIATAQEPMPFIGLYADDTAVLCEANVSQYVNTTVYVFVVVPESISLVPAVEFKVENLPTAAMAIMTAAWNTPLVIGTVDWDIALAFNPPLTGPAALLGTLTFFPLADFGADWRMTVAPGNDCDCLVIVDQDYNEIPGELNHFFTFNCTGALEYGCNCVPTIATENATWGQIKALY